MITQGRRDKLYLKDKKKDGHTYASRTFQKIKALDQELWWQEHFRVFKYVTLSCGSYFDILANINIS